MYTGIGLKAEARGGKDTTFRALPTNCQRVAFADTLKDKANALVQHDLAIDSTRDALQGLADAIERRDHYEVRSRADSLQDLVGYKGTPVAGHIERLMANPAAVYSAIEYLPKQTGLNFHDEETKKANRGFLIALGQLMRLYDPLFWVNLAMTNMQAIMRGGKIPVVTDMRFPNEADTLARHGFLLVRIHCNEQELLRRGWDPKFKDDPSENSLDNYQGFHLRVHSDQQTPQQIAQAILDCLQPEAFYEGTPAEA